MHSLLLYDKAGEALTPARRRWVFEPSFRQRSNRRGSAQESSVLIPRRWIVSGGTALGPYAVHPRGHWAPARPGRELDGVFTSSHDRLHPTHRVCRMLVSPCSMWGSDPSLGVHSITNKKRLGSLPQIVQLSFDESCRSLPSLAGTGPVPHIALT